MSGAIDVHALARAFGDKRAVDGVDLSVAAGEIYGFLGPNGAGKSTMVRMLTTLLAPTGGSARVAGFDVTTDAEKVRLRIGVALQDAALDGKQTGRELLDLQGRLYGLGRVERARRVRELLELVDSGEAIDRRIHTYSGGQTRRAQAFRTAAAVVSELSDAERADHPGRQSWTQLPGIGATTGTVLAQASVGRVPDYLARLRAERRELAPASGMARALRGDLHTHSLWSDGGVSVEEMMLTAASLGHEYCAVTDHSPRLRLDAILCDPSFAGDDPLLARYAASLGAELLVAPVRALGGSPRHDVNRLAVLFADLMARQACRYGTDRRGEVGAGRSAGDDVCIGLAAGTGARSRGRGTGGGGTSGGRSRTRRSDRRGSGRSRSARSGAGGQYTSREYTSRRSAG